MKQKTRWWVIEKTSPRELLAKKPSVEVNSPQQLRRALSRLYNQVAILRDDVDTMSRDMAEIRDRLNIIDSKLIRLIPALEFVAQKKAVETGSDNER
jgi:hypothetical protein